MFSLALHNLLRRPGRTALTLAAIALGVAGLILAGGFVADVFLQLRESVVNSQLGHMQVYREDYSARGRAEPYRYMIEKPDETLRRLPQEPAIKAVMQRIYFTGLANNGRADLPVIGEGIEPAREAQLGSAVHYLEGRALAAEDQYAIVLGEGLARALGLKPGGFVTLLVNTPDGALNSLEFQVVGVFRTISQDYDARAVRIPLPVAQELLATTSVHALVFALRDTAETARVAESVQAALAGQGYELKTWEELADFYRKTVDLYQRQYQVLEIIILVLVVLGVANSVAMGVYERIGEFGTLMALGWRGQRLMKLVIMENVLLGAAGALGGVALGAGFAWWISAVGIPMPPPPNTNMGYEAHIQIVPQVLVVAAMIGFIATVLASLWPAWSSRRLNPVEALRHNG
jgi:putative ABC transport system permease protein